MASFPISSNPLAMFDLTIPSDSNTKEIVTHFMETFCKKWCFQHERGDTTGYEHFQCRISLVSKKRLTTAIQWINSNITGLHGAHISATANPTFFTGNEFYVMKTDTRIDGPWSDRTHTNELFLPSHLRGQPTWHPWQQQVIDIIATPPSGEKVRVIINPIGGIGKSFLASWLTVRKQARRIPIMESSKDVMRMVMDCPKVKCYFIDFPRAISHKVTRSFIAGIEEITNGFAYDDRNRYQEEYFEKPHVFIFTNTPIDTSLLTSRRWEFYTVRDNQLIRITHQSIALDTNAIPLGLTLNITHS